MRPAPTLLALLLLAACGAPAGPDNAAQTADADATAPETNQTAAPEKAAPAPVVAESIPEAFRGDYDDREENCGKGGEGSLVVSAGELRFHESIGTVRRVRIEAPNRIEILADYQGEGESWQNLRTLALDGKRLTISGEGTQLVRVRCPASAAP
jgi:hypothetical protein